MYYVDRFLRLSTAGEIVSLKVFPNIKEISESMGAFCAVQKHIPFDRKDPDIYCYIVGDGHSPRTGILFARLTNWQITSIDPRITIRDYKTKRLTVIKDYVEKIKVHHEKVVIVGVHSHANPGQTLKAITGGERYFINIPCCVPFKTDRKRYEYVDQHIISPKNLVQVFKC